MKKVLFLIDTFDVGGATKLTLDLITNMDKSSYQISVIYLNPPKFGGKNLIDYFSFEGNVHLLWYKNFRFWRRFFYMYRHFRKFDLIHSCMEQSNFYSSFVRFLPFSGFKLAITFHGKDSVFINDSSAVKPDTKGNFLYNFVMKYMQNFFFRKTDLFIAVCNSIKIYLVTERNVNEKKVKVIYHGLNLKYAKSLHFENMNSAKQSDGRTFVIGYIGRLGYSKGLEGFVEIIPELIGLIPEIRVRIKGDGELKQYLVKRVNSLKLNDYVSFETFDKNVYEFYETIDLLVLPSFYETTNLTVLEAMYCRTLVLTSDAGGLKEVVKNGQNGFTFMTGDFKQIAEKIAVIRLLDEDEKNRLKNNGFETVIGKFDFDKNSKFIIHELDKLMEDCE